MESLYADARCEFQDIYNIVYFFSTSSMIPSDTPYRKMPLEIICEFFVSSSKLPKRFSPVKKRGVKEEHRGDM